MIRFFIFSMCFMVMCCGAYAQDVEQAEAYLSQYKESVRRNFATAEDYDALLSAHKELLSIIRSNPDESESRTQAQTKLADLYNPLQKAIKFFVDNDKNEKVTEAACAYVDMMSYCPNLPLHPLHINLTRLAAINTANLVLNSETKTPEQYSMAIPYLAKYIETKDASEDNRMLDAYEYLGNFTYQIKDYKQSYEVLKKGLAAYPDDAILLQDMLNTLQYIGKSEEKQQKYLSQALALWPDNYSLIRNQAVLYAKIGNDAGAVEFFEKLKAKDPGNVSYSRNLAYHYCNLGYKYVKDAEQQKDKKAKAALIGQSQNYFNSASSVLEELAKEAYFKNDLVLYNCALFYVYEYLNDKKKRQDSKDYLERNAVQQEGPDRAFAALDPSIVPNHNTIPDPVPEPVIVHPDSDVDVEIPMAETVNSQTFVVIIANENYNSTDGNVKYANHDGQAFWKYCNQTLGVPRENIHIRYDATLGAFPLEIRWLQNRTRAYSNANVIFYYAGHGTPGVEEGDKDSYLIPSDGNSQIPTSNYSLKHLYEELEALPAQHVNVFIDACFSGLKRDGGQFIEGRGRLIQPIRVVPNGNIVVFSACESKERAFPYEEKYHGMFTYFLLKKIQEKGSDVTLGELDKYIRENVMKTLSNGLISQTPVTTPSPKLKKEWENLPLLINKLTTSLEQ